MTGLMRSSLVPAGVLAKGVVWVFGAAWLRMIMLLLVVAAGILSAIGSGGGGSGGSGGGANVDIGTAPSISNLQISPTSASVNEGGGTIEITGSFDFHDPDGDIAQVRIRTSLGDDLTIAALAPGVISGTLLGVLVVGTTDVADVIVEVWLVDAGGHASNILTTTFSIIQDLDTAFGQTGIVITDDAASGLDEEARAVAVQADGKIVIAGVTYNGANKDVLVQRYNADGTLDTDFGTGGSFTYNGSLDSYDEAHAVAIQPDGKIVVAGSSRTTVDGGNDLLVLRLDAGGVLDSSFGSSGVATASFEHDDVARALALQSDGKIVVAGETASPSDIQGMVARFTSAGSLDAAFGTGGVARYNDPAGGWDKFFGVAVQGDGMIVATGSTSTQAALALTDLLVVRLRSSGGLDSGFGGGGVVRYDNIYETGQAVALQADGKIVIGGGIWDYSSYNNAALLLRFNSNGGLDTGFAAGGVLVFNRGYPDLMSGNALAIDPGGKLVLAGYLNNDLLVLRVAMDGSLDDTFSNDGMATVSSGGIAHGSAVAVQNNGMIVAAGRSTYHDQYSDAAVFLARLTGD